MRQCIVANLIAYLVVQVIHEPALADREYLVESSCDVESDNWRILYGRLVLEFFAGQPPFVGAAEVQFVTVLVRLDTAKNRTEWWQCDVPDASQLVVNLLLLHAELLAIG